MRTQRFSRRAFLSSTAGAAGAAMLWSPALRAQMPMPAAHDPLDAELDHYVGAYLQAMNAPGMTFALADAEKTLRTAGYGYANVDRKEPVTTGHLFQIGSITKSFVALVLLQFRDEGKLELHRPVLDYLPELPVVTEFGAVTTHHLLTHTSGLPDNLGLFSADPSARLIQGFKPGEHFHYCNAGFDILGLLAEKLDGRPWRVCVTERIFKPLGMRQTRGVITTADRAQAATGYEPYWDDQVYAREGRLAASPNLVMDDTAGCIQSTPADMALYVRMLLNHGRYEGGRIVSEESFRLMSTAHIKAEEFSPTASYGYGIAVDTLDGHNILRHTGGMVAFASSIHVDLDGGVAAFASINAMQGYRPTAVTEYAIRLARARREGRALPAAPSFSDPMNVEDASDYAGTYTAEGGRRLVFAAQSKRLVLVDGANQVPLQKSGGDDFVSTVPGVFATYGIRFKRQEVEGKENEARKGPVVEVSYGPDWYAGGGYKGASSFQPRTDYVSYTGSYRSDPWGGSARVYVLKDTLMVAGTPLTPLGGALFRMGDEAWSPLTVEFLHVFEGRARLMRMAGGDFWRVQVE